MAYEQGLPSAAIAEEARRIATIPQLLEARAEGSPARIAQIVDGVGSLTLGEWLLRSSKAAQTLLELGIRVGDCVALHFDNTRWLDCAVAYMGVLRAGGAAVLLSNRFSDTELRVVIEHCDARGVISASDGPSDIPCPRLSLEQLETGSERALAEPALDPSDLAGIIYTSGTTGLPKGVAYTHDNAVFAAFLREEPVPADGAFLHAYPLSVAGGQAMFLEPLAFGVPSLTLTVFNPDRFCAVVDEFCVNEIRMVPAMANAILESKAHEQYDLSSVRRIVLGTAATPPFILMRLLEAFPNAEILNGYSTTEAVPAGTRSAYDPRRPTTVGLPYGGSEVKVVDQDGSERRRGEVGEVWLAYPGAPQRWYYGDPVSTASVFRNEWVRTGDLGYLDADGYLYIVDRIKDVVNRGGLKVSSIEVEGALIGHPSVSDAAVFAVPDITYGEEVAAAIVARRPVVRRELKTYLRQRLADYKIPRDFVFVDCIPRNASGKALKRELREVYVRERDSDPAAHLDRSVLGALSALAGEILAVEDIGADDNLFDLGADSLTLTELAGAIEAEFGVAVPLDAIFGADTLGGLADELALRLAESEHGVGFAIPGTTA